MKTPGKEESYAERRLLFKDIWTAKPIQETSADTKPKIIRTARLEQDPDLKRERNQRYRHLKNVCNTILVTGNRQRKDGSLSTSDSESHPRKCKKKTRVSFKKRRRTRAKYGISVKKIPKPESTEDSSLDFDAIIYRNNLLSKLNAIRADAANRITFLQNSEDASSYEYDALYEKKCRKGRCKGNNYIDQNKCTLLSYNRSKSATRERMFIPQINITLPPPFNNIA